MHLRRMATLVVVPAALVCGCGGERAHVDRLAAPAGTIRAVWFEVESSCRKNFLRLSAVAPASICSTAMVDAGTLAPAADGALAIDRELELVPPNRERSYGFFPRRERTFELVAYGDWGAASFTNRARRFTTAWHPSAGPPALAHDPRAGFDFVPEPDRRAYALEPLGGAIHDLLELPASLRAKVAPFLDDARRLLATRLADPALAPDTRQLLEMHRLRLDEASRR